MTKMIMFSVIIRSRFLVFEVPGHHSYLVIWKTPVFSIRKEGRKEGRVDVAESTGSSRPEAPKSLQLSVQLEGLSVFSIQKEGRVNVN